MDIIIRQRRALMKKVEYVESTVSTLTELTATLELIGIRWDDIDGLEKKLDLNHQAISEGCDEKAYALLETEIRASFLKIDSVKIKLASLRKKLTPATTANPTPQTRTSADVKLPKLELPNFDGDFMEWITFKDRFEATIHNHTGLKGAEKLTYLMNALDGEPKGMVKSYSITDTNYIEAWNALNARYQSDREIVSAILKKLFSQPAMKEEDSTALRKLIDVTGQCIRSLKGLQQKVDCWDSILIHLVFEKLDGETRKQWELSLKSSSVPKFEDFIQFLEIRSRSLAVMTGISKQHKSGQQSKATNSGSKSVNHGSKATCAICQKDHPIQSCPTFMKMTIPERVETVKGKKLCFNCLRGNHRVTDCKSESRCKKCSRNHHTCIHLEKRSEPAKREESKGEERRETVNHATSSTREVLLGTAVIYIRDAYGQPQQCRALVDNGSEATFISEACVKRLGISTSRAHTIFSGVGSSDVARASKSVTFNMVSKRSSFKAKVHAYVLKHVTQKLPRVTFTDEGWPHTNELKLADPQYNQKAEIDVLLGADIVALILREGLKKGPTGTPIAQETEYGWVLSGELFLPKSNRVVSHATFALENLVEKFWEMEQVKPASRLSIEEQECEAYYQETTTRQNDRKFTVCLPFHPDSKLGFSRAIAERRFRSLERKLIANPSLYQQYTDVMQEYIELGHMSLVSKEDLCRPESRCYYVPHHGVVKESSETTKLRVVFDASARSSNGKSLNDILKTGPTIQDDLTSILLRFRTHPVAIMGDAEKMYRMVRVSDNDFHFQRLLWRKSITDPIQDYEMRVLMFGTKPAPWLATRTTVELAHLEKDVYPMASRAIKDDLYVDDLITGASSAADVIILREQVQAMMQTGGFLMRKWVSTDAAVMSSIPENLRGSFNPFEIGDSKIVKTLGISWSPHADEFTFSIHPNKTPLILTKRFILSEISRIFDPLGWLAPVIVKAKILIQGLWCCKIGWDELIPENYKMEWLSLSSDFLQLQQVKIPRCLILEDYDSLELYGFFRRFRGRLWSSRVLKINPFRRKSRQTSCIQDKSRSAFTSSDHPET